MAPGVQYPPCPFQNETLRRAILSPSTGKPFLDALPEDIDSPDGLIPAAVRLAGQPYRELAGNAVFLSSQEPRDLLIAALGDLGLEKLPRTASPIRRMLEKMPPPCCKVWERVCPSTPT